MISIIVPVLNNEKYLDCCIGSILSQTYENFELLLMVGQCRDKSLEKCIGWQKKDERITIVSRKDSSIGDARNYALPMARGEYIAYVDSDDWIVPCYLERLIAPLIMDSCIDIVCCGYTGYDGNRRVRDVLPPSSGPYDVNFGDFLSLATVYAPWSKLYRRQWLIDNGIIMYDGQCEDFGMHLMLAATAKKIYLLQESLYCYNMSNPNSLSNVPIKSHTNYAYAFDFVMPFLKKHGVIENYRNHLIRLSCCHFQSVIFHTDFEPEIVDTARWFIEKTFPEMLDYMIFEPRRLDFGNKQVIIFGSGRDAVRLIYQMPEWMVVKYIIDNDKAKVGQNIEGLYIKSFNNLLQERRDIPMIIASRVYSVEMAKQLHEAGFDNWFYIEEILSDAELNADIKMKIQTDKTRR